MDFGQIQKVAKLAGRHVPRDWQEDAEQEVLAQCLELQASGVRLTPENVSAIVVAVPRDMWRHQIHDAPIRANGHAGEAPISLSSMIEDSDGNELTLADALPSPACFANVEEWALARFALASLRPMWENLKTGAWTDKKPNKTNQGKYRLLDIPKFAAMALMDKAHLPRMARESLRRFAEVEGIEI